MVSWSIMVFSVSRVNNSMFNILNAAKQRLNTEQREVIEPRKTGIERCLLSVISGQSSGNQSS
jgi:hypothetical protein